MNKLQFLSFLCGAVLSLGTINAMNLTPIQQPDDVRSQTSLPNSPLITGPQSYQFKSMYTQDEVTLTQGSVVLFSENGIFGKVKTTAQCISMIPNINRINEANLVLLANWEDIQTSITKSTNLYSSNVIKSLEDQATWYSWDKSDPIPCLLSLDKTFVSLIPFDQKIPNYNGSVYYRNLNEEISNNIAYSAILDLIVDVAGKPAEDFGTLKEVLNALLDKNVKENTEKFFNSELTAYALKKFGIIPESVNCSNVIPAEFSFYAGTRDILAGKSPQEVILKWTQPKILCGETCLLQ